MRRATTTGLSATTREHVEALVAHADNAIQSLLAQEALRDLELGACGVDVDDTGVIRKEQTENAVSGGENRVRLLQLYASRTLPEDTESLEM